jgi:hypothetical protein
MISICIFFIQFDEIDFLYVHYAFFQENLWILLIFFLFPKYIRPAAYSYSKIFAIKLIRLFLRNHSVEERILVKPYPKIIFMSRNWFSFAAICAYPETQNDNFFASQLKVSCILLLYIVG